MKNSRLKTLGKVVAIAAAFYFGLGSINAKMYNDVQKRIEANEAALSVMYNDWDGILAENPGQQRNLAALIRAYEEDTKKMKELGHETNFTIFTPFYKAVDFLTQRGKSIRSYEKHSLDLDKKAA